MKTKFNETELKKDILLSPDSFNAAAHYVPFQYRKNGEITERNNFC